MFETIEDVIQAYAQASRDHSAIASFAAGSSEYFYNNLNNVEFPHCFFRYVSTSRVLTRVQYTYEIVVVDRADQNNRITGDNFNWDTNNVTQLESTKDMVEEVQTLVKYGENRACITVGDGSEMQYVGKGLNDIIGWSQENTISFEQAQDLDNIPTADTVNFTVTVTNNIPNTTIVAPDASSIDQATGVVVFSRRTGVVRTERITIQPNAGFQFTSGPTPMSFEQEVTYGTDTAATVTFEGTTGVISNLQQRSAVLSVTSAFSGPTEGYTITQQLTDTGFDGDTYNLFYRVALNPGYRWVGDTPTNIEFSGTWNMMNVVETGSISGTVEQIMVSATLTATPIDNTTVTYSPSQTVTGLVAGDTGTITATLVLDNDYEFDTQPSSLTYDFNYTIDANNPVDVTDTHTFDGVAGRIEHLDSLVLTATEFNQFGDTVTYRLTGTPGTQANLSFDMVNPANWTSTVTLPASVTIPAAVGPATRGVFEGTFTLPSGDMDLHATARLVATAIPMSGLTPNPDDVVNSGLFTHNVGFGMTGNLRAGFTADITGSTVSGGVTVTSGTLPLRVEIFNGDPNNGGTQIGDDIDITTGDNPTATAPRAIPFPDIDVSDSSVWAPGETTIFARITDDVGGSGQDVVIQSDTFTVPVPISFNTFVPTNWYTSNADENIQLNHLPTPGFTNDITLVITNQANNMEIYTETSSIRSDAAQGGFLDFHDYYSISFNLSDLSGSSGDTFGYQLFDTSTTPRTPLSDREEFTWHTEDVTVPTFADAEVGIPVILFRGDKTATFSDRIWFNANIDVTNEDSIISTTGFDWVTGHEDTIPEGSGRAWDDDYTQVGTVVPSSSVVDFGTNGAELTMRYWVSSLDDPSMARETDGTIIYGPLLQTTVP